MCGPNVAAKDASAIAKDWCSAYHFLIMNLCSEFLNTYMKIKQMTLHFFNNSDALYSKREVDEVPSS